MYEQKSKVREGSIKRVLDQIHPSKRDLEKDKLIARAEVGGTCDFADMVTGDPFLFAYNSRSEKHSRNGSSKGDLKQIWQTQIRQKHDSLTSQKEQ